MTQRLVDVDNLPVQVLIDQLTQRSFPEWVCYKGESIGNLPYAYMLATDPDFLVYRVTCLEEEALAFRRISKEVQGNPRIVAWATVRLKLALRKLNDLSLSE